MRWREGRDRMRIGSLMVLIVYLYLTVVIMPTMTQSDISLFNNTSNATNSETDNISEPTSMPIPSFTPDNTTDQSVNVSGRHNATEVLNQSNVTDSIYTNTSEINTNLTIPVLVGVPDFAVTNITFNPSEPVIGDVVVINATVSNFGVKNGTAYVEFYDNKSIELKRTQDDYSGWKSTNDTITLPGALKMRVHFSHIGAYSSLIIIYDRNNSKVERFDYPPDDITDYWTKWCDGDTIRIESQWGDFTVDRYDALLANESVSLNAARLTNISTKWNLSDQYMGWATHGEHNITVIVDHSNQVVESEETNNSRDGMVVVNPSLDFTVTNISFNEPSLNETVELTATVANYGVRDGTATVRAYCDEIIVNETVVSLNFTDDHPKMVAMWWNANITNGGAGRHNISVEIDPDKVFVETTDENNSFHERIFVNGTDLAVTDIEIPCGQFGGRRCYRDKNETITVIIANLGARNASTFTVMFSDGLGEGNRSGSAFFNKTIPRLNSSETTNINVTWTPREFGKHTITVSIPFDKRDNDEMNNELLVNVSVKPEYDVSVEDVSVYPARVKEGDNVTINASIANLGLKNGSVNVSFYVNSTDIVGSKHERYIEIGRTNQPVYVEPDKINNISFTWNAKITGGDHLIYAVVDPGNEVPEWPGDFTIVGESIILKDPVSAGNNVKSCILHVNHTQLSITNLTLAPSKPVIENKINVTAMIENNGNETANSTVQFYIEKPLEHTPRTGEERYSIFQPENLPIRVHFKYLEILTGDGSVRVDIDGERVSLYVKSVDVAEGQPIKVSEINFDSPCGDCLNHDATGTCTKRQWEDVWTEWRTAKNLTVHEHLINTSIDKYQVQLGNDTITIDANSNSSYNVMWNASLPLKVKCERKDNRFIVYDEKNMVGENYTLIANVENEVVRNETYLSGTDLAVDFSVNKTCFDGEEVNITAVIENLGLKNATEFMVNFSESYYVPGSSEPIIEPIYSTTIENLAAGNTTNISVPWNASIYKYGWHKNGEWIYDYTLKVEIKPLNNAKYEEKRGNDLKNWQVQLKCSRDFIIPNLSFVVNNETRDAAHDAVRLTPDETVAVNATLNVTNLAKNRGGTVDVSFYVDKVDNEHEIGNDSVEFGAGNGTSHAEIEWYVWDFGDVKIADDHDIIVVADPENKINELNESNNAATWQIHTYAAELTVTSLYFEPDKEKINKSDRINISFEVANYGHEDAKNVSLVVYDCADRQIENKDIKVYGSVLYPGLQEREIEHEKAKAKATKLYLDLEIDDGVVCIHDSRGGQIGLIEGVTGVIFKDNLSYYENFHGWTPWLISGDVGIEAAGNASAKVSKVYYLEPGEDAINTTYNLSVDRTEEKIIHISDNWTASTFGERLIVATIDPGNEIQEYNELNNTFARYITVNTSDLAADINLRWLNGTEIEKNAIIRDNDTVRIVANIINIGVEEVSNFDVRVIGGEEELVNETKNMTLMPGNSWLVDRPWTVKVGTQVIKVEVDYNNEINETNETNNINATEIDVHGAEVSGKTTWESSGLHGLILFDPSQPYEEDYVTITANITNSGLTPATNFSTALLFDYQPDIYPTIESNNQLQNSFFKGSQKSNTISYTGARGVYVCIDTQNKTLLDRDAYGQIDWHQVFMIYDKNNTEVARTDESCGVLVPGDTVKLEKNEDNEVLPYIISFYPVYRANLTRDENLTLNVNSSTNVSITVQKVTAGNHPVLLLIDPEGKVPEDVDNKTDNVVIRVMEVQTTRDFTVVEVIPERGNISDGEKINITANVSNAGYRNGTTTVQFVDYENESRIHSYYLTNSLPDCSRLSKSLLYLPVPPFETFSQEYKNLTILHRPGTDAIQLNFNWITQYEYDVSGKPCGEIHIYNLSGVEIRPNEWLKCGGGSLSTETINSIWIPGDTIFIYTLNADFNLTGYTTMKECHEENVTLNASVAWDESSSWKSTELQSESKKITSLWNASTGTHNVTAIIDPDDEIIENNETNNRYVLPLSVKATKELEIVDLNYSVQNPAPGQDPWHPGEGENVTIRAVVRNSGTATANLSVDLWLDTLKDSSSAPVPYNWNITLEGKTRYITFLSHTECSLAPGDHATVAARWENISVHGNPTYVVRAIADPLDEIDELNESNNEMSIELVMDYPDLTVAGFNAPTREERTASVELGNTGILNASEINVSLDMVKHEPLASKTGFLDITNDTIAINITMKGASKIRIHFASLDTTGENSYIEIRGVDEDGNLHPVKTYEGVKHENKWTPWWEGGGSISIDYTNANFYVDGYECGNIYRKEGASKIGICFNSLDTTGDNSYMDIYDGEATKVETYSGAVFGYKCTPWMKGNTTIIDYANAFFDVKELWWKEENITKIKAINASEREKVSLLESWTKYEGLVRLNVTVDPRNEIIEQREDNNNGSVLIYADLVPKGMDYVYETDKLIGFNASILNDDKAVEEGKGIAFPVYDFNVSLEVTPWDNETEVLYENSMRINESEKIYGGEVKNVSFNVDVNELPENRTYNFTVVADSERRVYSWGEIEEINEGRYNKYAVQAGPDISVGEIYSELISPESCECYVRAVIKNEGDLSASNFSVRLNLNSTSKNGTYEEIIPLLGPKGGETNLTFRKDAVEIEPNAIYDVKITADSNNTVDEGEHEGNNEKEERIGPDLTIDRINYYSAKGAQREGDKLIVGENQTISVLVNNTGKVGAKDFEVKIWINTTNNTIIYNPPVSVVCVPPGVVRPVPFQWTPKDRGWFILNATVDRYNNTPEWSKKGDAESNNDKLEKIKVGLPGYKAKEGFLQAHGGDDEFNGGVIYTIASINRLPSDTDESGRSADFGNPIPENATVRYARLYVYPDYAHWPNKKPWMAFLPDNTQLKVTFNGNELSNPIFTPEANNPDQPVDIPDATEWNGTYATYYYDVMAYYNNTPGVINQAVAERLEYPQTDYRYGIAGMALLIVYNDLNAPLMRYWVGDDRDLIYAKEDSRESTGFEYDECTRKVEFEGVTDAHLANATLKAVLVSYNPGKTLYQEAGGIADALYFNPNNIANPNLNENLSITVENKGHWHKVGGDIAITNGDNNDDGWVYVNNVREGTNDAAVQSRGAMMGVAHAILKVTYPPDLVPSVNTQLKATAGNPYDIPITITNSGKSTARNFDVRISIDGEETSEHIEGLGGVGPEGGNSKTINIRKIAPAVEGFITFNVTVVADPENKVQELINNVRNGETNNNITETVKVVVSSGSLALPGLGGGGGSGGGWGTGTGTGEGSGSGEGRGTAGGTGEGERGETGSKTITGRLMKGTTVSREAGGGGKGGLSLIGWLIRLAMLAVAVVLVYAGYWHEKRRHEPEQ